MNANYRKLVRRLKRFGSGPFTIDTIGKIGTHKVYCLKTQIKKGKKTILISAGIHGDEPAGPEAVLQLLENGSLRKWSRKFNFYVIPCINPTGYEAGTRENAKGIDVNRSFDDNSVKEAKIIKDFLKGKRFDMFIEFHEDWEYDGYYLYEISSKQKFGVSIVRKIGRRFKILNGEADGRPVSNGIVKVGGQRIPKKYAMKIMPLYIYKRNSRHIITSETPSKLAMRSRVQMHLIALSVSLSGMAK